MCSQRLRSPQQEKRHDPIGTLTPEVGQTIVAEVHRECVAALVAADRTALQALIRKEPVGAAS